MTKTSYDLDMPLLTFPGNKGDDTWTLQDAVEGVQIFGGIGSGKTSGSGRMLALKYLAAGFGGLVLTAKPDEKQTWIGYCKETGRENDLIIVGPDHKNYFNFLDYESTAGPTKSSSQNIIQVLKTVIRASEDKTGAKSDDLFWETALDLLITNLIDLSLLAYGTVTIQKLYEMAQTIPQQLYDPKDEEAAKTAFAKAIIAANHKAHAAAESYDDAVRLKTRSDEDWVNYLTDDGRHEKLANNVPEFRDYYMIDQFFGVRYMNLNEKTKSIIDFSFTGFLFNLIRDPIYSLFCKNPSTFTPEDCLNGKIILLDLPVKLYHKVGRDSQILFKYVWQRAMERRNVEQNERPVFLWADEAQHFLHEYDPEYQATARSSRIATVYLSQNLPNYHANMSGSKYDYKVKSFLGTLGTKIFHANADIETNTYASNLIGQAYTENIQRSTTVSGQFSSSQNQSFQLEKMIRPEQFVGLKTGGNRNKRCVEGYIHRQGQPFQNGLNFRKINFQQKLKDE